MNTIPMLKTLFPKTKNITEIAEMLEKHKNFGINTNLRLAHFLAQVREEIGEEFKPISENLNYSNTALKNLFEVFKQKPELADKYGRNIQPANQEMIANIAYANRLGNGNIESGDGWRYRGAGVLQITGKHNYQEVQRRIDKYAPTSNIDIIMYPKDIHTLEGSILAGLGFWLWKDLYRLADMGEGKAISYSITGQINKYTSSYEKRYDHFNKIKDLIS